MSSDSDLRRLEGIVRDVERLGLKSGVETEVVSQLLHGRRTISELVEFIFRVEPSSSEFHSCYVRVWRAVRELEAKGLVSAPVFGHEKVYRLTQHGLRVLLGIATGREEEYGMFSNWDMVLLASTVSAGLLARLFPGNGSAFSSLFLLLLGASVSRVVTALRRVW